MLLDKNWLKKVLLFFPLLLTSCLVANVGFISTSDDLSPYGFGLAQARTGVERYQVLLKTHKAAIEKGVNVNYSGIKTIELEIPENASRIPLTSYNDFQGCVLVVKNLRKTVYLFESREDAESITVSKKDIDSGDFRHYSKLTHGRVLLLIEDKNPWVENRKGYSYGHQRKDILLLSNGLAQNKVVMPYDNKESEPICGFIKADKSSITIKNLTVYRSSDCKDITNIFYITGKNKVNIENFSLHTPKNNWRNDRAVRIDDCTNVHLENVLIDETYSQSERSGYGISLDNVWNFTASHLVGRANWGVFGTNNMNTVMLRDCDINRFDIHCYGRDISSERCKYSGLYNQFSSVYGTISFHKCTFTDFTPVLMESSYNAYSPYDIVFKGCTFNLTERRNYIFSFSGLSNVSNSRPELRKKCMPNIVMEDCNVNLTENIKTWYLVRTGKVDYKETLDYASIVSVKNVKVKGSADFRLGTEKIKTTRHLNVLIDIHK